MSVKSTLDSPRRWKRHSTGWRPSQSPTRRPSYFLCSSIPSRRFQQCWFITQRISFTPSKESPPRLRRDKFKAMLDANPQSMSLRRTSVIVNGTYAITFHAQKGTTSTGQAIVPGSLHISRLRDTHGYTLALMVNKISHYVRLARAHERASSQAPAGRRLRRADSGITRGGENDTPNSVATPWPHTPADGPLPDRT